MNNKHRAGSISNGPFGDTAHEQALKTLFAMISHDYQVHTAILCQSGYCFISFTFFDNCINLDTGQISTQIYLFRTLNPSSQ